MPAVQAASAPRAVQRSLHEAVFGEVFDAAESISIACVGDILDVVCPEQVSGEAPNSGHDAGILAHPACVFGHGGVADVVEAVFYVPMATDRRGGQFGRGFEGREVVGGFAGAFPHAGSGVAVKAIALYADDSMDETVPIASLQGISDLEHLGDTLLMA